MWFDDQKFEKDWHGTCQNTYGEETKQLVYAKYMGLDMVHDGRSPFSIDMKGKKVLDIGGGPVSLLLKCNNVEGTVIDPCDYPAWVKDRYWQSGIQYIKAPAESIVGDQGKYDEVWIYNVLQHTIDPKIIISNALRVGKKIRIFEWIETEIYLGHPHAFTKEDLDQMLGCREGDAEIGELKGEGECYGKFYSNIIEINQ